MNKAALGCFIPKEPLLTRLVALVDTGMAVPRGEEASRLVTELTALGAITEFQLVEYFECRLVGRGPLHLPQKLTLSSATCHTVVC